MSLLDHPIFKKIKSYIRIQYYDRDGGHENPRNRIELKGVPAELIPEVLAAKMPCVKCSDLMHPFRQRTPGGRGQPGGIYYAACCPLEKNVGCSRGRAASQEYRAVVSYFENEMGAN